MRVAIVRLTSLGDVVHTLPLAHALRRHDPASFIVWIVEEREQTLLRNNAVVDEVVIGPTRRWRQALQTPAGAVGVLNEWRGLRSRLRALKLDVAIDVQGLLKSSLFMMLTRAPVRIGFERRHLGDPLSSLFTTRRVTPPPRAVHIVDRNLSLLGPLGIPAGEVAFPLGVVPEAERNAELFLDAHRVKRDDRLIVLLPATRGPTKQWPAAHYRGVAERLASIAGIRLLLLGGPGERQLVERMADGLAGDPIVSLDASISDMVALLRRAHLAVGNDTGPLHVAAALAVPTIGLYGPTRSERNGPYGSHARAIQSTTGRMEDISVDAVLGAILERLA